jgi:cytochrome c2
MKKLPLVLLCGALAAVVMLWLGTPQAKAVKQFKDQFEAKYVKPDSKDPKEKALAEAAAKAKCLICHEGHSKKNRNRYGKRLAKLLDRKKDKKNVEKIVAALDTVSQEKLNPDDANSPTFGDLIKEGKLPGGEPKEK